MDLIKRFVLSAFALAILAGPGSVFVAQSADVAVEPNECTLGRAFPDLTAASPSDCTRRTTASDSGPRLIRSPASQSLSTTGSKATRSNSSRSSL